MREQFAGVNRAFETEGNGSGLRGQTRDWRRLDEQYEHLGIFPADNRSAGVRRNDLHALELAAQSGHQRTDEQLVDSSLHVRCRCWPRVSPVAFQMQDMQLDILVRVNADSAVQFNRHNAMNAAGIDMQIQTEDDAVMGQGNDLQIGQGALLRTKFGGEDGGQSPLIERDLEVTRPRKRSRRISCACRTGRVRI